MSRLERLLAAECRRQRGRLIGAAALAAIAGAASVALLGLSGWFITAAAAAGITGAAAASSFNAILPSAGIRLLAILRTGCRYGDRVCGHDAALRAMANLRPALFRGLAAAPAVQSLMLAAGDATARVVQDATDLEVSLVQRTSLWGGATAGICGVILMLAGGLAPAIALGIFLVALLIGGSWLATRLNAHGRAIPAAQGSLRQEVVSVLAAAPELRAYGFEEWAADRVGRRSAGLLALQCRVTAVSGSFDLLLATGSGVAAFAALLLAQPAGMPLAALAALGAAASVEGLGPIMRVLQHRGRLKCAQSRIGGLLTVDQRAEQQCVPDGFVLRLPLLRRPLRPGQIVGLEGPSGCGKTTLLETMVALRPTQPGAIGIGGMDLADLEPACARTIFAYAPQDAMLLAGTVRENLCLAAPAATEPVLWQALHDAALDDRVRALPQGLDTWLGENGLRLSGGERRRLVLARAYLSAAPWLLLDEPTEGLDAQTESVVVQRLRMRLAGRHQGAIIVSHRPVPLTICEMVVAMAEDGSAATGGTTGRLAA